MSASPISRVLLFAFGAAMTLATSSMAQPQPVGPGIPFGGRGPVSPDRPGILIPLQDAAPPTNVTATPMISTITVKWDPVSGAAGYSVHRAPAGTQDFRAITSALITDTWFTDKTVTPGSSYDYRVSASRPDNHFGVSAPINVRTLRPVNPTNFRGTAQGSQIILSWDAMPEVSFYHFAAGPGAVGQMTTQTSYIINNVQPGIYSFALLAYYGASANLGGDEDHPVWTSVTVGIPPDVRLYLEPPAPGGSVPPKSAQSVLAIQSDGTLIARVRAPLAGVPDKMWDPGQTLRVRLIGGTAGVRSRVRRFATEWSEHANIYFQFVDESQPAEIRATFKQGKGSWSNVGRDALGVLFDAPTMNFGWFDDNTTDDEVRRTTLHEFGHALGLIHEHQSPAAGIAWDREKVYAYFAATQDPPWDRAKVDDNVFDRYSASSTNYSQFDQTSIMAYNIPASLTLDGKGISGGTTLSNNDKEFIRKWYPFPGDPTGQLRTNDDCDEIEFTVDYNSISPDSVAFVLRPGTHVTWWKSISVPIGGANYAELEIQDGSSAERQIARADLDNSRPIRFSKAKFLGIHTKLGYAWDVMPALLGGTQVTLNWNRDSCR